MIKRCAWVKKDDELYQDYHDKEWGKEVRDDKVLFEFLLLESFQAGLSWITILRKRKNFKKAFDNFDYNKISNYSEEKIKELLQNEGIIRNKLKIFAAVSNAKSFIEIQKEFGSFSEYIWKYFDNKQKLNYWDDIKSVPVSDELSDKVSKDLKKRGFKFMGTTIVYSYFQAVGLICDHTVDCFCHPVNIKIQY